MANDPGWLRSLAASLNAANVQKWQSGEETITLDATTMRTTVSELRRIADRLELLEREYKDTLKQLYEEPLYPERPEDE